MRNLHKKLILRIDYFILFSFVLTLLAAGLVLLQAQQSYQSQQRLIQERTREESARLDRELHASLGYLTQISTLIGQQIEHTNIKDLQAIHRILSDVNVARSPAKTGSDLFSWTLFDWTNAEGKMVVSTMHGVLAEPVDKSFRSYAHKAPEAPWILHFDTPAVGTTSGQWVIPSGLGVQNAKGEYLGLVSLGIDVARLSQQLESLLIQRGVEFLLLNDHGEIILASGKTAEEFTSLQTKLSPKFQTILAEKAEDGFLAKPLLDDDTKFLHYQRVQGYPFILVTGYNATLAAAELRDSVRVGFEKFVMLAAFLSILMLLRYFIVQPIRALSEVADAIAQDEEVKKIPRSYTYETTNLAKQLLKVKRFVRREKIMHEKLAHVVDVARESDKAREKFMYDMHRALAVPLSVLKGIANLLRKEELGALSQKNYGHIFDVIEEAAKQLETYTTDAIFPSEFSVPKLVRQCIKVHQKQAVHSKVQIIEEIDAELPLLWADRLRIQQVILSALYHSLQLVARGCEIHVRVFVEPTKSRKKHDMCVIQIEDNGAGATEEQRAELFKFREFVEHKRISKTFIRDPDMTRLDFPVIRHLLALHHGSFALEVKPTKGSLFTIRIPYLTQNELPPFASEEPAPKRSSQKKAEKQGRKTGGGNVVPFPKGVVG